jgi:hypothetical protein
LFAAYAHANHGHENAVIACVLGRLEGGYTEGDSHEHEQMLEYTRRANKFMYGNSCLESVVCALIMILHRHHACGRERYTRAI